MGKVWQILPDFLGIEVVQVIVVDVEGEVLDVFVESHYLLLGERIHLGEQRPLNDLHLRVARFIIGIVTLKVDIDWENDSVTCDEFLDFETG